MLEFARSVHKLSLRRIIGRAIALSAAGATLIGAQAPDRARVQSETRRASERLLALQREADALAAQERSLLIDLRRLEVERDLRTEQLKQAQRDADQVAHELGTIGNEIDALESRDAASRPALQARLAELYKLGRPGYVRMLLDVSDLQELGRAYRTVSALAAADRRRADEHRQTLQRLQEARAGLEQRHASMAHLEQEAVGARAAADRAAAARAQLIAQIDARRDLTAQLAGELQTAQQRLQQTLGAMATGEPRSGSEPAGLPIRPFRGDLDWPVAGRVMTRFGGSRPARVGSPLQNGIQIAAPEGAVVRAVHGGLVVFAGPFTGFGNLVILDHGGDTYSLYGELETLQVSRGARIEGSDPVGTTGRVLVGIPGVYFEMRVDGKPVDPLEWLRKRP